MKKHATLATAVVASLGAGGAEAAVWNAQLISAGNYTNSFDQINFNLTSTTATFTYDDATQLLTQTGGTVNARVTTAPTSTIFRHLITGLVIGNGGSATASSFVCAEGNFGAGVGAHICGNYTFGANFFNESTASWGPGTAAARTIGGDDLAVGAQQTLATYNGMATVSWVGTTLVLSNATCTGPCTTMPAGTFSNGYRWALQTVPVPAAAWLLGGALGALGLVRRRHGAG